MFGPLAMLVALGVFRLKSAIEQIPPPSAARDFLRRCGAAILIGAVVWSSAGLDRSISQWLPSIVHLRPWSAYERTFSDGPFADQKLVAAYLAARTSPADTVLQWGFDPLINYIADRRSPTRFGFNYPLVRATGELQKSWREQFMRDLRAHSPAYIVICLNDTNNLMPKTSTEYMKEFPEFDRFVSDNFILETRIAQYEIWRRKPC
jgi:hypothetical protein